MQFPFDKTSPHTTSIGPDTNFLPTPPLGQATSFDQTTSKPLDGSTISIETNLPMPPPTNDISPLSLTPEFSNPSPSSPLTSSSQPNSPPPINPPPHRSSRPSQPPPYLSEYKCDLPHLKSVQSYSTCSYTIQASLTYD